MTRRSPSPWTAEVQPACFVVRDRSGQAIAYVSRALQHYMGHKNIMHTVRYNEMAPDRFKNFWKD
jgi:hypothetical protein